MKQFPRTGNPKWVLFFQKSIAVFLALVLWQILSLCIHRSILLVGPWEVVCRLATIWKEAAFWSSLGFTFLHISLGFLIGLSAGVLLAFLASRFRAVEILLWPYMISIRSVPVASIIVICLIWLSAGNLSLFISFLMVLPVVYQNMLSGLRFPREELQDVSKVFGASAWEKMKSLYLPQVAPYLYSACSIAAGFAWKAGVAAEVIGTPAGSIGHELYLAKIYLDTDDLFAWTVVIVLISVLSEKLFLLVLRTLIKAICGDECLRQD